MQIDIDADTGIATGKVTVDKHPYNYVAFCNRGTVAGGYEITLIVTNSLGRIIDSIVRVAFYRDCDGYANRAIRQVVAEWKREQDDE